MDLLIEIQENVVVVNMKGNILGGPDGTLLYERLNACKDAGQMHVVLNMKDVAFMNSSGLGMLISGMTTMRNAGGDLRLANVPDKVRSLLIITKLNTIFKIFDSIEDAVASFDA
jgi:anti-sigma B factor antagonist